MATNQDIKELLQKYMAIENEIKLLQEDKKDLLDTYKEKIDPKAFSSALRAAKISAKVKPQDKQEFDQALEVLEDMLTIEHVI
tara:strand:- start:46 stop:294 length:249 start_codon:yes stop_codon:yes gene_type:complete